MSKRRGPKHLYLPGAETQLCRDSAAIGGRVASCLADVDCGGCLTAVAKVAKTWRLFSTAEMDAAERWLLRAADAVAVIDDKPAYVVARTRTTIIEARRRLRAHGSPLREDGLRMDLRHETSHAARALCALAVENLRGNHVAQERNEHIQQPG